MAENSGAAAVAEKPVAAPRRRGGALALKTGDVAPSGQAIILSTAGAAFTATQAILPENFTFEVAQSAYDFVERMRESSKFWQGDILSAVHDRHEAKYSQLAALTGQAEGSLRNMKSVAEKFAPERRRPELSWGHHQAVQSLPNEVADKILADAVEGQWTVEQVRAESREWREENANGATPPVNTAPVTVEYIGIQPVDEDDVPEDQDIFGCAKCPDLTFDQNIMHCLTCGAHYTPDEEACPYHDDDGKVREDAPRSEFVVESGTAGATGEGESGGTDAAPGPAVSGQVITPADQASGDWHDLLSLAGLRGLDVAPIAGELRKDKDSMAQLMGLHEWLGRVIEAAATKATRSRKGPAAPAATEATPELPGSKMAGQPAPKPSGKKPRRGKAAEPVADEPETPTEGATEEGGDEVDGMEFD